MEAGQEVATALGLGMADPIRIRSPEPMTTDNNNNAPATPLPPKREQREQQQEQEQEAAAGFQTPPGTGGERVSLVGVDGSGHTYHTHARRRRSQKPRVLAVLGDPEEEGEGNEEGVDAAVAAEAVVATPSGSIVSENRDGDEDEEEDRDCPICFSPFVNRSVHRTRCGHHFHKSCMVSSRAAHINGCPCCRAQITPGLTPFDAQLGRNNLIFQPGNGRDTIASRARAARQAVMARFLQRRPGAGGAGGAGAGGQGHMRPRGAILDFDLLGSPSSTARPRLDEAFAAAEQEEGDPALRARLAAIPAQPLSPEAHGHRIDHGDDLPH